jgi:hypothetical protein
MLSYGVETSQSPEEGAFWRMSAREYHHCSNARMMCGHWWCALGEGSVSVDEEALCAGAASSGESAVPNSMSDVRTKKRIAERMRGQLENSEKQW